MEKLGKNIKTSKTTDRLNDRAFDELFKEVLNDEHITDLIHEHNLTTDDLLKNDSLLVSYLINKEKCVKCLGLSNCRQTIKGHLAELYYEDETLKTELIPCNYQQVLDKQKCLKLIGIDESLYHGELITNPKRKEVLAKVKKVLVDYANNQSAKGFYLHGTYGCGKTFILAFLARMLADNKAETIFAYYPDVVRKLKSLIGKAEFEEIIEELKNVEVLVLDDFGGETPNSFIRDEVLLPILQERMDYKRLTFMSSNLSAEQLLEHLAEGKGGVDMMRASRVWERIKVLMDFVELKDENYR
ncbi:MAG: ATP-binding protein [Bacilli bacterium]|nr:ATP-binding protein [Bacilli bacterium]